MTPRPDRDLTLSTCAGVPEAVRAFEPVVPVALVDAAGETVREIEGVTLFVKSAPEAARRCGGVGTWDTPGAQLGVSFFVEMGRAAFDVAGGVVWIPRAPTE